jgi:hypothetical protein
MYENFKITNIPKFAIDIRKCSDDKLMEILNYLEKFGKLRFNPSPYTKEKFIKYKDSNSRAWCWTVNGDDLKNWGVGLSGIHNRFWYDEKKMGLMIKGDMFLVLGLEESINYMKVEKEAKKFNL